MSIRFQARIAADTVSEYLAATTRGAPVAQTKHSRQATLVGETLDATMGATAVALYDVDAARITMGAAYLTRGGLAALGALFTGFNISFGNGASSGDPEKNDFNRKRRAVSAGVNVAIGTALLTGVAGREAAMAGMAKGAAEAAFGPLVETLTRPTMESVPELIDILSAPRSMKQQRVAASDLELIGVEALPRLCEAYGRPRSEEAQDRLFDVIHEIIRWPTKQDARTASALAGRAVTLIAGRKESVERGVRLLDALSKDSFDLIPKEHIASLLKSEERLAAAATGTPVGSAERALRNLASAAIARVQGKTYVSLDQLINNWDPGATSARVAAIGAFGAEAIEPLRENIAGLERHYSVAALGAEVSKRLETMPVDEALSIIPDNTPNLGYNATGLAAMRRSGSIHRQELDNCVRQAADLGPMLEAHRALLAEIEASVPKTVND